MTKSLINYLTIILFLIPFTLLIVDNSVLFPYITTKAIFFRILVSIGLFLALWIYFLNPQSFPKKNYLFLATVIFFVINILANLNSVDPYRSFWGNAERMEGLWSLFFYLSYFFLLLTLFQFNPQSKKIIFYSILIVTTLISLIEIQQAFIEKQERPSATLGNATYVGFLNLLTIFLILYFYFETKNYEKIFFLPLIVINLISLIGSETRGSILGLLVGFLIFLFFYFLFSKIDLRKKILIFLLILFFLTSFYFFLKTDIASKIPGIKRLHETLFNPSFFMPRFIAWQIFFDAFKERPILGWGQETMSIAFFSHFKIDLFNYEKAIFDRPHNKFVEILSTTGILGFVSWLFIFIAFIYYLFQNNNLNNLQRFSLLGFIVAYFIQIFTLFDIQASYLLLFFGLALVTPKIENKLEEKDRFIRPYLILIGGIVLIFIIIHLQHFYIVKKIIYYLKINDPQIAGEGFIKLSEIAGPFLNELSHMSTMYFSSNLNKINNLKTFYYFYQVGEKAYEQNKLDYRTALNYISLNLTLIYIKQQIKQNFDSNVKEVENIFNNLLNLYPKFYEIYISYADFLYKFNKIEKAQKILNLGEKYFVNSYIYFFEEAKLYFKEKDFIKAKEKLEIAFNKNLNLFENKDFEISLRIFLENKDYNKAKKIIYLWINQNNSDLVKQEIVKILKEYNQIQLLKFNKN